MNANILAKRLARLADTQEPAMRDRLHAALRVGAELALARVKELGGSYPTSADFSAVLAELEPSVAPIEIQFAVPDQSDEPTRMAVSPF